MPLGLVEGIALVTFPAASTIFTSPSEYGLSNTQYGPCSIAAVIMGGLSFVLAPKSQPTAAAPSPRAQQRQA